MTTRNLNKTWYDVVVDQYTTDFEADVPFPKDIFIEIPAKILVATLRRSVWTFVRAKRLDSDPAYRDDNISVRARVSFIERQAQEANKQHVDPGSRSEDSGNVTGDAGGSR
ncbi:hypothetical protein IFM46972_07706 [Aspergillus udagawae]|uniref:Uncharacterized protein n=1 Tax=Aspergillus udagawae TaxID=91492 RepID=A0A8H3P403_9EURO|nr:hypothetical protein IFM46972_07706 [Aspergillus udagawae]